MWYTETTEIIRNEANKMSDTLELVIITGMSGAGKTVAVKVLRT